MKKLFLCLLLLPCAINSQVVNIPDTNFKNKLLSATPSNGIAIIGSTQVKIDTNDNGQIEVSEAAVIQTLTVSGASIADLTGIEAFTGLKILDCSDNDLPALNLSGLNLEVLNCQDNNIVSLDVSGMGALISLNANQNQLTSLNVSGLSNLQGLSCQGNDLTALDLTGLPALADLDVTLNPLASLDVSGLSNLHVVRAEGNDSGIGPNGPMASINASGCTALATLYASANSLANINLTGCNALVTLLIEDNQLSSLALTSPLLQTLDCSNNLLTTLDLSALAGLKSLYCYGNLIQDLDVSGLQSLTSVNAGDAINNPLGGVITTFNASGCPALANVFLYKNQLTSMDLSGCTSLYTIDAGFNQLVNADLSGCTALYSADLSNNPPLETIFVKNGRNDYINFMYCPNLVYICADESQVPDIQTKLDQYLLSNAFCNSYCSFTPGGTYNTISGNIRFDAENNGCDAADMALPYVKVNISGGTNNGTAFSNSNGNYSVFVQQPDIVLTPQLEIPAYFNVSPVNASFNFPSNDNTTQTQDFCITPNGPHPDVEVTIIPLQVARPGFDSHYYVSVRNKGNQTVSGSVDFGFDEDVLDFVSAEPIVNSQTDGNLMWNYSDLQPFSSTGFSVTLNVNAPTETPAVNIDDVLHFSAVAYPISGDETTADNQFVYDQAVVGSFDPNDKTCLQGSIVSTALIGDYLHYVINFENTGTFPAEKVVIKDQVDGDKFEVSSFQVLGASHVNIPVQVGNKIEFYFQNINLMPGAYGYVAFKIKTKNLLTAGTTVSNKASIYFDFNFPINTNTVHTTFQDLGISQSSFDNSVVLFPNPAAGSINIKADTEIQSIRICDTQGRSMMEHNPAGRTVTLDVSSFAAGIYYLEITTAEGLKREKLLKN